MLKIIFSEPKICQNAFLNKKSTFKSVKRAFCRKVDFSPAVAIFFSYIPKAVRSDRRITKIQLPVFDFYPL